MIIFKWIVAQVLGLIAAFSLGLRRVLVDTGPIDWRGEIEFGYDTLLFFADRILWLGATLALYPLFDFLFRSADEQEVGAYAGSLNAIILILCLLNSIVFAVSLGVVLIINDYQLAQFPATHRWFGNCVIASAFLSFFYVVRAQYIHGRRG